MQVCLDGKTHPPPTRRPSTRSNPDTGANPTTGISDWRAAQIVTPHLVMVKAAPTLGGLTMFSQKNRIRIHRAGLGMALWALFLGGLGAHVIPWEARP